MSVFKSYLSVVTRPSGYAIAILLPKDETYAVLGSSQLDGSYDPLHLLGYIVGLWDAAVNQPRVRQGLAPVGPHCLLCNHDNDIALINQMLKQTGGIPATASHQYAVSVEQTARALLDVRERLAAQHLLATHSLIEQLHWALAGLGDLNSERRFDDIPLHLAAIAQVSAYEQANVPHISPQRMHQLLAPAQLSPTVPSAAQLAEPSQRGLRRWLQRLF